MLSLVSSLLEDSNSEVLDLREQYLRRTFNIRLVDEKKDEENSQISFLSLIDALPESNSIKIVNLGFNKLSNRSLNKESIQKVIEKFPKIKLLDCSFNTLKDIDILAFEPFIERKETTYLDLTGTRAGTIFGLQILNQKLSERYKDKSDLENILSKVIWIPERVIDSESTRWNAPQFEIDSHKEYFKRYY